MKSRRRFTSFSSSGLVGAPFFRLTVDGLPGHTDCGACVRHNTAAVTPLGRLLSRGSLFELLSGRSPLATPRGAHHEHVALAFRVRRTHISLWRRRSRAGPVVSNGGGGGGGRGHTRLPAVLHALALLDPTAAASPSARSVAYTCSVSRTSHLSRRRELIRTSSRLATSAADAALLPRGEPMVEVAGAEEACRRWTLFAVASTRGSLALTACFTCFTIFTDCSDSLSCATVCMDSRSCCSRYSLLSAPASRT
jgi:hypothetical protein